MIVNFSIENFGPVKEKQTLSFEAEKSTRLEDYYVVEPIPGVRLLKLALIYGANASGKTTIIKALDFLQELVFEPKNKKTDTLDFEPFLFDPSTPSENSVFSIEFIQNKIRYYYEVEFNKQAIIREELYVYNPTKYNVYKRTTDIEKQLTQITFGNKIKIERVFQNVLEANTLWNNTVLGGFIKTNIEQAELKNVKDWFSQHLLQSIYPHTNLEEIISSQLNLNHINKNQLIKILKKADFNISGIIVKKKNDENIEHFVDFISKNVNIPISKVRNLVGFDVKFEHTIDNNKYILPAEQESNGTNRYYGLAGLLYLLIKSPIIYFIDELEASLHPDLFIHFLLTFLVNAKNSQLIATTHNREILNNKDIFRNDAIWFTDKSECGATQLYSLADFDTSVIRDTSNVYNAYKTGKLGGVPNLGDYYIDLDDAAEE